MTREDLADLTAFLAVAEERSFTVAAARIGMSQSALSQIVRRLESRLGVRLLTRTTRSVAPTEAGERLLATLSPAIRDLDVTLAALGEMRERPAGTIRINAVEHAADTVLYPVLRELLPRYPEIKVEIVSEYGLVDIVAERYDAGVRLGEHVDKDMVAVRIAPDLQMTVVGAPAYFDRHPRPAVPQDLVRHRCISLRWSATQGHFIWEFRKKARELKVRVDGPLAFNAIDLILEAALDGFGLGFLSRDRVEEHVAQGRLVSVAGPHEVVRVEC
jgi:LysR family transcriptional regulator, regulator of peptidoglycan recycling